MRYVSSLAVGLHGDFLGINCNMFGKMCRQAGQLSRQGMEQGGGAGVRASNSSQALAALLQRDSSSPGLARLLCMGLPGLFGAEAGTVSVPWPEASVAAWGHRWLP